MSKTISMTIPEALHAALELEGAPLDQEPGEVIKSGLIMAYRHADGWTLKLKPVVLPPDPNQPLLPLDGVRTN